MAPHTSWRRQRQLRSKSMGDVPQKMRNWRSKGVDSRHQEPLAVVSQAKQAVLFAFGASTLVLDNTLNRWLSPNAQTLLLSLLFLQQLGPESRSLLRKLRHNLRHHLAFAAFLQRSFSQWATGDTPNSVTGSRSGRSSSSRKHRRSSGSCKQLRKLAARPPDDSAETGANDKSSEPGKPSGSRRRLKCVFAPLPNGCEACRRLKPSSDGTKGTFPDPTHLTEHLFKTVGLPCVRCHGKLNNLGDYLSKHVECAVATGPMADADADAWPYGIRPDPHTFALLAGNIFHPHSVRHSFTDIEKHGQQWLNIWCWLGDFYRKQHKEWPVALPYPYEELGTTPTQRSALGTYLERTSTSTGLRHPLETSSAFSFDDVQSYAQHSSSFSQYIPVDLPSTPAHTSITSSEHVLMPVPGYSEYPANDTGQSNLQQAPWFSPEREALVDVMLDNLDYSMTEDLEAVGTLFPMGPLGTPSPSAVLPARPLDTEDFPMTPEASEEAHIRHLRDAGLHPDQLSGFPS